MTNSSSPSRTAAPRSVASAFYGLGLTVVVFFVLWVAQGILVPLVVATLLTFLIVSVKNGIDRIPVVGRFLPSPLSYFLSFAFIAAVLLVVAIIVRENVEAVLEKAPDYQAR
ncbi:MAG: hypothetical protein AAGA69_08730, partial [Pseudomonadota bacterium]